MGWLAVVSVFAAAAACGITWRIMDGHLRTAREECDRAAISEAAATRTLRLFSADLRDCAMTLVCEVEQLASACPNRQQVGAMAALRHLNALVDDLQDATASPTARRVLSAETVPIEAAVRDAIEAVSATLTPGRCHWRIDQNMREDSLLADRRALAQILTHALGNAARHSRHGDSIDIGLTHQLDGVDLTIEDEGSGLCAPDRTGSGNWVESRGLGLGLTLARSLMQAHGGSLLVESVARVGTRVVLRFPAERVIQAPVAIAA